jgi:hypothetical protein
MASVAINNTDWLMRLLSTQSKEVKLDIISRLSASLTRKNKAKKDDMSFFDSLTKWDYGTPVEEEVARIKAARHSGH